VATDPQTRPELRFEFVGMMFAVVVGEIGIQAADLATAESLLETVPAIAHLVLASVLVAASWIGWSCTRSPGGVRDVQQVLSLPFLVLVIDVALVILYFIVAKSVEIQHEGGLLRINPSARPEARWLVVVFGMYFVWDIVTKGLIHAENDKSGVGARLFGPALWRRGWVSLACIVLAWVACHNLADVSGIWSVAAADGALLCLVLLFRALKQLATAVTTAAVAWSLSLLALFFAVTFVSASGWAEKGFQMIT
jgi:hypothetical protein